MPKPKPPKVDDDFPLYPRANGQWAKKIKGKLHYFGVLSDPAAALAKYIEEKDDLKAGKVPRTRIDAEQAGSTVADMVNQFLTEKEQLRKNGEITDRTFAEYHDICEQIVKAFGRDRALSDLRKEDFTELRARLAVGPVTKKKISSVRHGNLIRRVRSVFKFANESDLTEKPVKFGPGFKGPSKKVLRKARAKRGKRLITAHELRESIKAAKPVMKAMILLAINCGLGNTDLAQLTISSIDLKRGWLDYPRPKTGIERRCPLWEETIDAVKAAIELRPNPKDEANADLMFITKYGAPFVRTGSTGGAIDSVYAEFIKLLKSLKLARPNLGFYTIRHTFQTVGDGAKDPVATSFLMGHAASSGDMSAEYREDVEDNRLSAVVNHIRTWLWPAV